MRAGVITGRKVTEVITVILHVYTRKVSDIIGRM